MRSAGGDLQITQLAGAVNGLFLASTPSNDGLNGRDARPGQQVWHYPVAGGSGPLVIPVPFWRSARQPVRSARLIPVVTRRCERCSSS